MTLTFDQQTLLLEERVLSGTTRAGGDHEERLDRLAAVTVRRQANQHDCHEESSRATCTHPHHRRDRFYAWAMLEALGLSRDLPPPTAEDRDLFFHQEVPGPSRASGRGRSYTDYGQIGKFG